MKFKEPSTNLEDLVDYYKSLKAEENVAIARLEAGLDPHRVKMWMNNRKERIEREYSRIIDFDDCYFFTSIYGLGGFLRGTDLFPPEEIQRSVRHEWAHTLQAQHEGFLVSGYYCWLAWHRERITHLESTRVEAPAINRDSYTRISLAPDVPSLFDKDHIKG